MRHWIDLRDRFALLGPEDVLAPCPRKAFPSCQLDTLAVSGDGTRVLTTSGEWAWLLDATGMTAKPLARLPGTVSVVAINSDGTVGAVLCGTDLYRWDLVTAGAQPEHVWSSDGLGSAAFLSMSREGGILVAADASRGATVRVFDLQARTLVYDLDEDCDEGIALHPDGQHLVCFADQGHARVYSADSRVGFIEGCGGGALSPDGKWLLTNDFKNSSMLRLYPFDRSRRRDPLGARIDMEVSFEVERWNLRAHFAPDGGAALVQGPGVLAYYVNLKTRQSRPLMGTLATAAGMLADGRRAITGLHRWNQDEHRGVGLVLDCLEGKILGYVVAAERGGERVLAGALALGFHGTLEQPPASLSATYNLPFERPDLLPAALGAPAGQPPQSDDQMRVAELAERKDAWNWFRSQLTTDLDLGQLMTCNQGLVHLTPEIVHRAERLAEGYVRFGPPKIPLRALEDASAELAVLSMDERGVVFDQMLRRLRTQNKSVIVAPEA